MVERHTAGYLEDQAARQERIQHTWDYSRELSEFLRSRHEYLIAKAQGESLRREIVTIGNQALKDDFDIDFPDE